jgi:hypothetical protein
MLNRKSQGKSNSRHHQTMAIIVYNKYRWIYCLRKSINAITIFIRVLSFIACLTFNCFISITFCFVFYIYCFDHENDYLIKREWVHMKRSNFSLSFSIISVRCLCFFSMFNTYTQNTLDNSSANKSCSSSIYSLLSTKETIVWVVFIIIDSRWSEKGHKRPM